MMLANGQSAELLGAGLSGEQLAQAIEIATGEGARVVADFNTPDLRIAVLAWDASSRIGILNAPAVPETKRAPGPPESTHTFAPLANDLMHEVAVGPVHAGVIEPGHFRFQCFGETVLKLEIMLGYQHRGVEDALLIASAPKRLALVQEIAGDTTIGHTLAYAQVIEALCGARPSARAHAIRAIALELERMANHVGDIGAIAGDIGYQPTSALCGRLRGAFLNLTAEVCGNRFGRWLVTPGGVLHDITPDMAVKMRERLNDLTAEFIGAADRFLDTPGVLHRLEHTATVDGETAGALGLVGVAARASGLARDVRQAHPAGYYTLQQVPMATADDGDVYARALVRRIEVARASAFVQEALEQLPEGDLQRDCGAARANAIAVSLVEGWRGEIAHIAITDATGNLMRYKVVDPSSHNWPAVAAAMTGQQISDFPLCNKSFNLSYAGNDL